MEKFDALNLIVNWANGIFPLYHGTDMRIVKMSDEERNAFRNDCDVASQYLWEKLSIFYKEDRDFISKCMKEDKVRGNNLGNALNSYSAYLNGNIQYQYDSFHLTTMMFKAENYALRSFAFGEVGLIPYRMYDAIKHIKCIKLEEWSPDDKVKKAIEHIVSFAEDDNNVKPVVLEFNKLDFNFIELEDYGSIWSLLDFSDRLNDRDLTIHYKGTVNLDAAKVINLKQNRQ